MKKNHKFYNQSVLKKKNITSKDCNSKHRNSYPFNRECLLKVFSNKGNEEYVGSTGVYIKIRYNQYKYTMNNNAGQQTTLSKFYKFNTNSITNIR